MRIVLELQYNGKDFFGWQVQPGKRTIQGEIERAVEEVTGKHSTVTASGRTDSGVHALCQIAHFDTESSVPPERYSYALNIHLPPDVKVIKSYKAEEGFHARYSAKRKTYRYTFYVADTLLPLYEPYAEHIFFADEKRMEEGARYIVGEHDFTCFLAANSDVTDAVRTVYSCDVKKEGRLITITITGNGFLYNMVRIIAGTLLAVGQKRLEPEDVKKIIEEKKRNPLGKTMAGKGLMLVKVEY